MEFSPQQLENWKAFEHVRKGGKYNMFDSGAQKATKLSEEEFMFSLKHYIELKAVVEG